jgi:hypothetical protein
MHAHSLLMLNKCHAVHAAAGKQVAQWVFLTDNSCSQSAAPCILAIQLQGQSEAIDFLDNDIHINSVVTLRCAL